MPPSYILLLLSLSWASAATPGQLLNLTGWKLQTPVDNGKGGVVEISEPELDTFNSSFFYVKDNYVTFAVPENGAHTSGSSFPRSELRELYQFFVTKNTETHIINATAIVLADGSLHKTAIGQIHGTNQGHCSIVVELEWFKGDIIANLRDEACGSLRFTVGTGYKIGDEINYIMTVKGTTVTVATDRGSMRPYSYTWWSSNPYPAYFKAGNYLQSSGSSASIIAEVQLLNLVTTHLT
jgi:Alginate lyase